MHAAAPALQAFDLAEQNNAPELSKHCALYCLEHYKDMLESGVKSPAAFAVLMQVRAVAGGLG